MKCANPARAMRTNVIDARMVTHYRTKARAWIAMRIKIKLSAFPAKLMKKQGENIVLNVPTDTSWTLPKINALAVKISSVSAIANNAI